MSQQLLMLETVEHDGRLLLQGKPCPQDLAEAMKEKRLAAEADSDDAAEAQELARQRKQSLNNLERRQQKNRGLMARAEAAEKKKRGRPPKSASDE